jgi:hypothetical protein
MSRANFSRYSSSCRCASLGSISGSLPVLARPSLPAGDEGPASLRGVSSSCSRSKSWADTLGSRTGSGSGSSLNEIDFLADVWEAGPEAVGNCGPASLFTEPPDICSAAVAKAGRDAVTTSSGAGEFGSGGQMEGRASAHAGSGLSCLSVASDSRVVGGSQARARIPQRAGFPVTSAVEGGHKGSGLGSGTHPTQRGANPGEPKEYLKASVVV